MEHTLQNDTVSVTIWENGAELRSLKYQNEEFMWDANPDFWGKTSPILFPFIGGSINNQFTHAGKVYPAKKHGFARDYKFEVANKSDHSISFVLKSNAETLQAYPFEFELYSNYDLTEDGIWMTYQVVNPAEETMYFNLGGHPAFAMPIGDGLQIEDYYVEFEHPEEAETFLIEGVLLKAEKQLAISGKILNLKPDTFAKDAFVLENLKSQSISLKCHKNSRMVKVDFPGFPYLALWNKPNAPYLCIEPWYGINDFVDSQGILKEKTGIQQLAGKSTFEAKMKVTLQK